MLGSQPNAMAGGVQWIAALLTGSIGTNIAVLGIAALGILMLFGYIPVRRGGAVLVGCFIILSAESIGDGLTSGSRDMMSRTSIKVSEPAAVSMPQGYDPYAFASLRQ